MESGNRVLNLAIPGQKLRASDGVLRGHGTFEEGGYIYSSICGVVEVVDQLIYVRPIGNSKYVDMNRNLENETHCRYDPEIGDIVVGRIDEVCADRWRVNIHADQRGQLPLASINLPGGEQRRRNFDDQLDMRKFYQEGDCVCLEVQRVQNDGGALLHARNARYGTLRNGCLAIVPPALIRRQPLHMVTLESEVHLVLGNNGLIWISTPPKSSNTDTLNFVTCPAEDMVVSLETRKKISRVRNIILALASSYISITPEIINSMYTLSLQQNISVKALLDPKITVPLCDACSVENHNIMVS